MQTDSKYTIMDNMKSYITGMLSSLLAGGFFGFLSDVITALIFGIVGVIGGWLGNKLIKWIESKKNKNETH